MANETTNPTVSPGHHAPLGLRGVATYEFIKGLLFVAIALGLLSLVHKDVADEAQEILRKLHLDPTWHYSKMFINATAKVTDTRLRIMAGCAGLYATIRIVAAYGLWHERPWAEWFTVICAGIYVPIEIYRLIEKPTLTLIGILLLNLAIIVYLGRILSANHRRRAAAAALAKSG